MAYKICNTDFIIINKRKEVLHVLTHKNHSGKILLKITYYFDLPFCLATNQNFYFTLKVFVISSWWA